MLELSSKYPMVMSKIQALGGSLVGITVMDCAPLRDMVRLAVELAGRARSQSNYTGIDRLKLLVLSTLASTYTFNNGGLETGQQFPESLGPIEMERWGVGMRYPDSSLPLLERLVPGRYTPDNLRLWETQVRARIGDCGMYSTTLAILLACTDLCDQVIVFGAPPHAWVRARMCQPAGVLRRIDLSEESHGGTEDDYEHARAEDEENPPFSYDLSV